MRNIRMTRTFVDVGRQAADEDLPGESLARLAALAVGTAAARRGERRRLGRLHHADGHAVQLAALARLLEEIAAAVVEAREERRLACNTNIGFSLFFV